MQTQIQKNKKMKSLLAVTFSLLNINFKIFPNADLYMIMFILIVADFITGVLKSVVLKKARTSEGYRKTIVKFCQYGGAIAVSMVLSYMSKHNVDFVDLSKYSPFFGKACLGFIIFIEATSILENVYAMDPESKFSKYGVKQLLMLMTFQMKNNPLSKLRGEEEAPNETTTSANENKSEPKLQS
jgi:phage-related holin